MLLSQLYTTATTTTTINQSINQSINQFIYYCFYFCLTGFEGLENVEERQKRRGEGKGKWTGGENRMVGEVKGRGRQLRVLDPPVIVRDAIR